MKRLSTIIALFTLGAVATPGCNCNPPPVTGTDAATCAPGSKGCACNAGACDEGLECKDNLCQTVATKAELGVSDAAARACEVLLRGGTDLKVEYDAALTGRTIKQGELTALAFTSNADAPIAKGAIKASATQGLSSVTVVKASCFNGSGKAIPGATVSLGQ